jgi:hypothetical protein
MEALAVSQGTRVWSPRQIGLAALLGSPLAAAFFFSRNYVALFNGAGATRVLGLGVVATILVGVLAFFLPRNLPNSVLPAIYTIAIERYAAHCFETRYAEYVANGGTKGSWWTVVGISLLACIVLFALLIIGVYVFAWWQGQRVDWGL